MAYHDVEKRLKPGMYKKGGKHETEHMVELGPDNIKSPVSPPRQPFPGFSHQSTRPHLPRRHHRELVALAATLIRTVSMSRSLYAASARSIVALIALSSDAGTSNDVTSPCGILAKIDS